MKIRHSTSSGDDKIEIQMTPMIDIVFQLLVFFIMTFKIVSQEGDFNIKMPLGAAAGAPDPNATPPIKIRLEADPSTGELVRVGMGTNSYPVDQNGAVPVHKRAHWVSLNNQIIGMVGTNTPDESIRESLEVELDCDFDLSYEHVVAAITAVSGHLDSSDNVVKLVEKIKFSPPRAAAGGGG